ncbi:MAG: hypothetical protein MK102_04495 [Fuerstiella sp.]|nr:hypothetical protein [Fuerstiella sp.]
MTQLDSRRDFMKGALGAGIVSETGSSAGDADNDPDQDPTIDLPPRIMFYHDGRHPLFYMYEPPMQKEECEAAVDELAGTPVEALMFCLGDGRTMMHDTKAGELWGHNVDVWTHQIFRRTYQNAKGLIDQGHDPLRIICERAHEKDMLLYPTLLVQLESGVRGGGGYDIRSSNFRLDNKRLDIGGGNVDQDFPGYNCADFKHREVRDERFAIINEVLTQYPVDGIELQLNFWPYYFHPDEVTAGRNIMTEWIARVHEAVKRSGSRRELVISIPSSIETCLSRGLDPLKWIERGIVDVIVAHKPAQPELMDPNGSFLVYEEWLLDDISTLIESASGSQCRIHAAIDSHLDSDRLAEAPIEMIRAAACNFWNRDVAGLYVSQWHGNWPYDASFYEKLRELPHPDIMASRDKFYHIPTIAGRFNNRGLTRQLPAKLEVNRPVVLKLEIADDLPRWDAAGRVHDVLLRLRVMNTTELDSLSFRLNGVLLPETSLRRINQMYRMSAPRYRTGSGYWFIFRLDRKHWPRNGKNSIEVALTRRDPDLSDEVFVRDVELEIKYLMGKNFHRGQDLDIGPSEASGV